MWQSLSHHQAGGRKITGWSFHADIPKFYLPPKEGVYENMEASSII